MNQQHPFKWRHFASEIILLCVRWYLRSALSYRDREEMLLERGLQVDHTTSYRWVQRSAPELDKRCRPQLKACHDSWKVDETSIKVKKTWTSLYRAVDAQGNTLAFLLSLTRDAEAARCFFVKALHSTACAAPRARPLGELVEEPMAPADPNPTKSPPRMINVDKKAASPKALVALKAAGILPESVERRPVNYLKNLIEQAHRFIKRLVKAGLGFFSVETAGQTPQGYEAMHLIRTGQMHGVNTGESTGQVAFIASLFGVAA